MTRKTFKLWLLLAIIPLGYFYYEKQAHTTHFITLQTPYGNVEVNEPVIAELIKAPAMQRLKYVHQYGITYYISEVEKYFRYDHSIGVFALLRKFKAPLKEQIAGLLHDTSHTVFSHVGDHLFKKTKGNTYHSPKDSYQDDIHAFHLSKSGLGKILQKYDISVEEVIPESPDFKALEKDLPDMCADRIEYNLQGGLRRKFITQQDVDEIVEDLRLENDTWYFNKPSIARKFANISLYFTQHVWGTAKDLLMYKITSHALQKAMDSGLISIDEVLFSTDVHVLNKLKNSNDPTISACIKKIYAYKDPVLEETKKSIWFKNKFRGINPLVKTNSGLVHLTEIDTEFKEEYTKIKNRLQLGWHVTEQAEA